MPRPLRVEFENAWYHVMNRGAGHKNIYRTNHHRRLFLSLLAEATTLFGIEIHAYCLMSNHYHLLMKTPLANLSRAMRHINGVYTQWYNRIEKTDGPLFRGRYKAIIISYDEYFLNVSRYIHLNPVSAKIIKQPADYKWSSYQYFLNAKNKPQWLQIEETITAFGSKVDEYIHFINLGLDKTTKEFYEKNNTSKILGSDFFKDHVLKMTNENKHRDSITDYNLTRPVFAATHILSICAKILAIDINLLIKSRRGKTNEPRKIAMYACRLWGQEKLTEIAKIFFTRSSSNISDSVNYIKNRMKIDDKLKKIIEKIYLDILMYSQTNT